MTLFDDPDDPEAQWTAGVGPGVTGSFVRAMPVPDTIAPGPSFAPRAAAMLNALNDAWGLGLGRLEAARSARG